MSQQHKPREERGTIESYVTGFAASLAFTLIPYFLVRNYHGTGKTMVVTIMALAMIQLVIQIVFFLHLGRGPKPRWELLFFYATFSMILVVVGGSLIIVHNLHSNMSVGDQEKRLVDSEAIYQVNGKKTGACQTTKANHRIVITNGVVSPLHITADQCDTLTFISQDSDTHTLVFGNDPTHDTYAGQGEISLRRDQKTDTLTLSEVGNFTFHDSQYSSLTGSFLVVDSSGY